MIQACVRVGWGILCAIIFCVPSTSNALVTSFTSLDVSTVASTTLVLQWSVDNATNDDFVSDLEYSLDGSSWATIITGLSSSTNRYTWNTSPFTSTSTVVRLTSHILSTSTPDVVATSSVFMLDNAAPQVTIETTASTPTVLTFLPFVVRFSEKVFGFYASKHFSDFITLMNGVITNDSTDSTVFSFDVIPTVAGTVSLFIRSGAVSDVAGNNTASSSIVTLEYASNVRIESGPDNGARVATSTVVFTFSAPTIIASAECSLDQGAFVPCTDTSSHTLSALSEGAHTFVVKGYDGNGNLLGAVGRSFTVRTTGTIQVILTTNPQGPTGSFVFSSSVIPGGSITFARDGDSVLSGEVPYGRYTIATSSVPGWSFTSAGCSNGSSFETVLLNPNEDIVCTATFTQLPTGNGPPVSGGGGGGFFGAPTIPGISQVLGTSTQSRSTSTTPQPTVLGASTVRFTKTLQFGMRGEEVRALQERLRQSGFLTGPSTGYFGILTLNAVRMFQKSVGLEPVGFVGVRTREKLNNLSITTLSGLQNQLLELQKLLSMARSQ
ncbi:peptidoglycan-binding protein [bacterium]|nr:peptidoglycan-binding protein [bacterium]